MKLGAKYDYVMQSLLALSATHLASTVKSAALDQIAFIHRGNAFRTLSQAVGVLTQENSDAVLAASAMLSWQSPGWLVACSLMRMNLIRSRLIFMISHRQTWAALVQGIKTVKISHSTKCLR